MTAITIDPSSTRIQKGSNGWNAKTRIKLPGNKVLDFYTAKNSKGQLYTSASVLHIDGLFESCTLFQDYQETLAVAAYGRITEKVIKAEHQLVIGDAQLVESVMDKVRKQYNI